MKYNLDCKHCDKKVEVSTHDAVKFSGTLDGNQVQYSFDCPICDEEILAEIPRRNR